MKKIIPTFGNWDIKSLGEGGFGEVYHCKNRYTGEEVATKRLKINNLLKPDEIEVLKKRWKQEYEWLRSLEKTLYIVDAVEIDDADFMNFLKAQNDFVDLPVIIMEYCNGGDLRDHLRKPKNLNGLRESEVRDVLLSIRKAIQYLHETCKIEHRDIKPENIVVKKFENNKKLYKLTDFGYAKDIPESTIAQSVVGTRHYVAPEVVDPGNYTQTVDYWSIGVMAFEIMCGTRPFIPHQNYKNIITFIQKKPYDCIAIAQMIEEPITDRFIFQKNIYPENHQSDIFKDQMEKWLYLALDKNYKTRGYTNNDLNFYKDLDKILQTKILTVFCLKNYKIFCYEIEKFKTNVEFFKKLSADTNIFEYHMFLNLPTGHPKQSLKNIENPVDLFVPDWCNLENHAMLYIADVTQCDFKCEQINISPTIKKMMNKDAHTCISKNNKNNEIVPEWLLEQFERHVHFVLSNQQYLAECYVKGLYEYILNVENEVFIYEQHIDTMYENVLILSGRVKQFKATVQEFIRTHNTEISWLKKAEEHAEKSQKLKEDIVKQVKIRFKSVHKHCRDLASYDIYKNLFNNDIFKLHDYHKFLSLHHPFVERMEKCQRVFENFIQQDFESFITNMTLKDNRESIQKQMNIFLKICECVENIKKKIVEMENKLNEDTTKLMLNTSSAGNNYPALALKMNSLCIDGAEENAPSNIFMNGHCSLSNGEREGAFDTETSQVIEESNKLLSLMTASMDIDEDFSVREDLPTTIINI